MEEEASEKEAKRKQPMGLKMNQENEKNKE